MRIDDLLTDDAVLAELGQRLARARLAQNASQASLATEAGVSARTVTRIEAGEPTSLINLIRVMRGLGLLESFDAAVPEHTINPFTEVARDGKVRRRASRASRTEPDDEAGARWVWGDERGEGR